MAWVFPALIRPIPEIKSISALIVNELQIFPRPTVAQPVSMTKMKCLAADYKWIAAFACVAARMMLPDLVAVVCTENLIRIDQPRESPNLSAA
jgi:hypothetical protein